MDCAVTAILLATTVVATTVVVTAAACSATIATIATTIARTTTTESRPCRCGRRIIVSEEEEEECQTGTIFFGQGQGQGRRRGDRRQHFPSRPSVIHSSPTSTTSFVFFHSSPSLHRSTAPPPRCFGYHRVHASPVSPGPSGWLGPPCGRLPLRRSPPLPPTPPRTPPPRIGPRIAQQVELLTMAALTMAAAVVHHHHRHRDTSRTYCSTISRATLQGRL